MMNIEENFTHKGLFQIGDVAKCCSIDRQTILFYEKKGLITATKQNESSGYRYYSIEAITELMQILQLRDADLSIQKIKEYLQNGILATQSVIKSMEEKLTALLAGLELVKTLSVEKGDYTVTPCKLPEMLCYVKECLCHGIDEAIENMYSTFKDAMIKGLCIRDSYNIFADYPNEMGDSVNLTDFVMRVCLPVDIGKKDVSLLHFPTMSGISVCHRGDYNEIGKAYDALWSYVREKNLTPIGAVREYYLESRHEYENDVDRYVTRLVLPIDDKKKCNNM